MLVGKWLVHVLGLCVSSSGQLLQFLHLVRSGGRSGPLCGQDPQSLCFTIIMFFPRTELVVVEVVP